jgi:hypothetical protein
MAADDYTNPPKALAEDDRIGKVVPGFEADIYGHRPTKSRFEHQSPEVYLPDVRMVWVAVNCTATEHLSEPSSQPPVRRF